MTATDASLREALEGLLRDSRGDPVRVAALERAPSPFATLFPVEVLSAALTNGERVAVFLKQLGPEEADHPEKRRRDREVRVYEELLGDGGLPVVRYFGARHNEETGRHELFLEYVADWNLECQEIAHWVVAARRLGEMHAHFARRPARLAACDFLLRFDAAYLHHWADRAVAVVGSRSAALAARLAPVARDYHRCVAVIAAQPPTLVHNDPAPKNVLADRSASPSRICFVDWEMAGVGCGVLDLVDFKYGLGAADDLAVCAAYREAVAGTGILPPSPAEEARLLAACELHKTMYRLAFSTTWAVPPARVDHWVTDANDLLARL